MPKNNAEVLSSGKFRVASPTNLDLAQIHGNDYTRINDGPDILWGFWERERAILGRIAGTEEQPWDAAYPGLQYVQNRPESVHMVIAPRRDHRVTPMDLEIDDTARATAFMQEFLGTRDKQTFAGYNIGPEKDGSQMWWSWHVHLVQFGEGDLQDIATRPRIVWEPWPAQIQETMGDLFVNKLTTMDDIPPAEQVDLDTLDRFGFSSFGSTLLRFAPDISARKLATIMHHTDVIYKGIHGDIKDIIYQSKGTSIVKRDPEDRGFMLKEYVEEHEVPDATAEHLANFGELILPEVLPETPSRNSPLTLPNYSAAVLHDESGTYFLMQPHIFRKKASALSSLGILLNYSLDTDPERVEDYVSKKIRDTQLVDSINAELQL